MARTSVAKVREIIDTESADPIVQAYVDGASNLVDSVLGTSLLSGAVKTEIETWLAAHMIAVSRERPAIKEGAGGAFIEYSGEFSEGLKSTSYGQMVLVFDSTGAMANLGSKVIKLKAVKS